MRIQSGSDPDPQANGSKPTPFFIDFKDEKKKFFPYFFLITFLQAHHLQSTKFNFLLKFCVKCYFAGIVSVRSNPFMRKRKDPDPASDLYLCLMDP
jgi:hypothetical protein